MSWDGSPARFTDEQYARSCVLDRGGTGPIKERYSLPVREPSGALNCDGVTAAQRMIGQVKGASAEQLASARSKLDKLASQCSSETRSAGHVSATNVGSRPEPGQVEERSLGDVTVDPETRKLRGVVPYNQPSKDLGGWTEVIESRALQGADLSDLVVTVDHVGLPLGRYPGTLELEDRADGLHWACEPPRSRQDVIEAVERGDLRASSWRMVVAPGGDRWEGNTRYVSEIRSLRDVAIVTLAAYSSATAELRELPEPEKNVTRVLHIPEPPEEAPVAEEEEVTPQPTSGGLTGLTVEARSAGDDATVEARILDAMRGVPKGESRSLTHSTVAEVTLPEMNTFLWDRLRAASVVLASGVRVVTTTRKEIDWPRLTQDMAPDFVNELDPLPATDIDLDTFKMTPVKLAGLARGSSEAFDDSDPDLLQLVNSNLATVLALKFDAQALAGDTAVTPKGFDGLVKIAGQTINVGGALTNYDPFIEAFASLAEQHVPGPYVVVMHPRVDAALALIKEFTTGGSNVGLPRPPGFPPVYISSQLPLSGGTPPTSTALVYSPAYVLCCRRMDSTIEVDRSAEFTTDAVLVRGRVRATIGSPHTNAIVKLTGIQSPVIGGVTVGGTSAGPLSAEPQATTRKR